MADMLKAPTDNLYKFLAVFGLIMILGSASLWWKVALERDETFVIVYSDGVRFAEKYSQYATKVNELIDIYNSTGGDLSKLTESQIETSKEKLRELEPLSIETGNLYAETQGPVMQLQLIGRRYQLIKWLCGIGILVGLIISFAGFYLWHNRLQVHLDKSLQSSE